MSHIRLTLISYHIALLTSAFAWLALSAGTAVAGCQSGNIANNTTTFLLATPDCQASASAHSSTAVGAGALAPSPQATAVGQSAYALGTGAIALGYGAGPRTGSVDGATMVGALAGIGGAGTASTAIGSGNSYSISNKVSSAAHAFGGYSVAIGGGDHTTFSGARADGYRSIAIGQASVSANFGTSVGFKTTTAFASTAIGTDSKATGDGSSAFGRFASAQGTSSLSMGEAALASKPGSVALGSGSLANIANTVSVGTNTARRRIVNVAPGVGGSDAVTLAQARAIAAAAARDEMSAVAATTTDSSSTEMRREMEALRAMVRALERKVSALEAKTALVD